MLVVNVRQVTEIYVHESRDVAFPAAKVEFHA